MSRQVHDEEEIARLRAVLGPRLRKSRKAMRLTQEQAATLIAISAEFYARMERGHALPSVVTLHKMASAFDVSVDFLLGIDDVKPQPSPPSQPTKLSRQIANIVDKCRDDPELRRLVIAVAKLGDRRRPPDPDDSDDA